MSRTVWGLFELDLGHISYIIGGRNPTFSVWIHLGVVECHTLFMSQCQNSSKFLSVSYLMKTADVIMNFFSSHNTTDHTK